MERVQKRIFFLSDLGGVLIRFRFPYFCQNFASLLHIDPEEATRFLKEEGENSFHWKGYLGLSKVEMYHLFLQRFPRLKVTCEEFIRCLSAVGRATVEENGYWYFMPLMGRMKLAGITMGVISNIDHIHKEWIVQRPFYFWSYVKEENRFFSCDVKMAKPDPELYYHVFRSCHLDPKEDRIFLLDDRKENIDSFNSVGGVGIHFPDPFGFHELSQKIHELKIFQQ